MDVATVVDVIFPHIFLTGKTGKVDMLNILITMQQFHICHIFFCSEYNNIKYLSFSAVYNIV